MLADSDMHEGRILSQGNPSIPSWHGARGSCRRQTLTTAPGNGASAVAICCQQHDPGAPDVLLAVAAILYDRVESDLSRGVTVIDISMRVPQARAKPCRPKSSMGICRQILSTRVGESR
jgi:hypothetical protein